MDLVVLNSQFSPDIALENAERILAENADLVMMFQTYAQVASVISTRARGRRMPLIAIEMPHPNAIYFGVDNCHAGLTAGRYLAQWAEQHWKGQVDVDLPPFLRQTVKTQNPMNGEMSHGFVT